MKSVAIVAVVVAAVVAFVAAPNANALPAYSRLYSQRYGYRPSCAACHENGGGSAVTDFGRDFLRAGANSQAFARLEPKDSDADGVLNADEVKAKSNPGDARSKPGATGDWLADAAQTPVPRGFLTKLFPDAEGFSALEGALSADQLARVKGIVGVDLGEADKLPTFYFALKGGKKFAVVQYVAAASIAGPISIAVAMNTNATVTAVKVLKNPSAKAIEAGAFLSQFAGKRAVDALEVGNDVQPAGGADEDSRAVALAVKKAIAVINVVFSG